MSSPSERPLGGQDPYAPKRSRDQEPARPQTIGGVGRGASRGEDETSDAEPVGLRRIAPPPLIGRPPQPRPEARRTSITARDIGLVAAVSMVSALAVIAFYRFANNPWLPSTAPQVATTSARVVEPAPVTPPAAPADEPANAAAAPSTAPAAAAPSLPTASPPAAVAAPASPPTTSLAAAAPASGSTAASPPAASPAVAATGGPAVRGVTDTEIRFGIAAPFSGPARELGRQMKIGLDTAFGNVNDLGGINSRQLRLVAADDGYEPTRTLAAMKQLVDKDGVFGVVGNVGTPTAAVALPYALQQPMLFFGAFTGAGLLRRDPPDRYVFNYRASYAEETDAAVQYLVKVRRLKPEQIAVFAQQDGYGDSGFAGVVKAVRALHADPDKILRLNYQRNTVEVGDAVAALRAHKTPIKAIVMVATYRAAARFIEKTRDVLSDMIYTNVSFVGSSALAEELMLLGPKYAEGVIVTQVVPAIEGYSSFVLEYKRALAKQFPGETPDYVSLEGYVTGELLAEGLRRTGPQVDTEKLVDGLESLASYDPGLGTSLTFGRTEHQASHKIWGTRLTADGHYQPFDMQ